VNMVMNFRFHISQQPCRAHECSKMYIESHGSFISIVSNYGLDVWVLIPGRAKNFSFCICVQTSSEVHPASYPMGTGGPFPGCKDQPRHDADHSPISFDWAIYLICLSILFIH
jgi:hypothetical protein